MKKTSELLIVTFIFVFVLFLLISCFFIINPFKLKEIETETNSSKFVDTNSQNKQNSYIYKSDNFIVISEDIIPNFKSNSKASNYTIIKTLVDKRTKIMYFLTIFINEQSSIYYPDFHTSNLQVILNSEGKPLLYEKELENETNLNL